MTPEAGERCDNTSGWTVADLWLSDLPPLVLEAVPPLTVDHPDAVEDADDEQRPHDADSHRSQHPGHVTRLPGVEEDTQR